MMSEPTFLGLVKRVTGSQINVELSQDIQSAGPIIDGRVHRIGQIGSFVRIPLGFLNVYGVVSMVGASDMISAAESHKDWRPGGLRWIEVQLVGESYKYSRFERGVSLFPTLDDEVHLVTEDDLKIIYSRTESPALPIGTHAMSDGLTAYLDLNRLVTRHAAIVGSTGSGKSNAVAHLLKTLTTESLPNASVVVIDPHGEYRAALGEDARVLGIDDPQNPLFVPYWALSFEEFAWFMVDRKSASESMQDSALRDRIFEERKKNCNSLKAGAVRPSEITVDSPVPFSVRDLWYFFDRRERVTYTDSARSNEAIVKEGNPATLTSATFKPHSTTNTAPFKPTTSLGMGAHTSKMLNRLKDTRFSFLLDPGKFDGKQLDLSDLLASWLGHDRNITVFDLAGVPPDVLDLVVAVICRTIFEGAFWGRRLDGMGRDRPVLLIFEEAHVYLPRGGTAQFVAGYAGRTVRKVFKEGRKYGIGAIIVSQRPSELDETALSQCGTFLALRLSNAEDQGRVRSAVPESMAGLLELLPSLRTGEAIVLGEAIHFPSRVRIPLVEPRPDSNDPKVGVCWSASRLDAAYDAAVTNWRRQQGLSVA